MRNTKIEWCDVTWNPVTGCYHGCLYCYARKIAERFGSNIREAMMTAAGYEGSTIILEQPYFYDNRIEPYPYGFSPTFHMYRLHDLERVKEPSVVFVCSMADLFGDWVTDRIIALVMEACRRSPQHTYLFLTKNPARYQELIAEKIIKTTDVNFWLGRTITGEKGAQDWCRIAFPRVFWSIEPMLGPISIVDPSLELEKPKWVVMGAETGNSRSKVVPDESWVKSYVKTFQMMNVPILMKDSLLPIVGEENMIRMFPEELQ